MLVFVHIPPIFSVLLTYSLKINSLLFLTHPVYAAQGLCNGRVSVCPSPSVCLSHHSTTAAAFGGPAAEHHASRRYRSTVAGALQQMRAVPCWQPSWRGWTQACFNECAGNIPSNPLNQRCLLLKAVSQLYTVDWECKFCEIQKFVEINNFFYKF